MNSGMNHLLSFSLMIVVFVGGALSSCKREQQGSPPPPATDKAVRPAEKTPPATLEPAKSPEPAPVAKSASRAPRTWSFDQTSSGQLPDGFVPAVG